MTSIVSEDIVPYEESDESGDGQCPRKRTMLFMKADDFLAFGFVVFCSTTVLLFRPLNRLQSL